MSPSSRIVSWVAQLIAVAIMGQTLFFKFTNSPTTVAIFEELNMPGGGYVIGSLELIACLLLLIPKSVAYGAILGCGLMAGAIMGHITTLGFDGERGELAALAGVTFASCAVALFIRRQQIPVVKRLLQRKRLA